MNKKLFLSIAAALWFSCIHIHPGILDHWEYRNPTTTGENLNRVIFQDNQFVVVGQNGTIALSSNALTWEVLPRRFTNTLWGITKGSKGYIAVGDAGKIIRSDDGRNWQPLTAPSTANYNDICFGRGLYVAVGYLTNRGGVITTSSDGTNWTERVGPGAFHTGVTYGTNYFVVTTEQGELIYSTDTFAWHTKTVGSFPRPLYAVAYGNGMYLASGRSDLFWSPNGVSWGIVSGIFNVRDSRIAFVNGRFMMGVNGSTDQARSFYVNSTTNTDSWQPSSAADRTQSKVSFAYGAGKYVAVGSAGSIIISDNGLDWTNKPSLYTRTSFKAIAHNGATILATDTEGKIHSSTNGIDWQFAYQSEYPYPSLGSIVHGHAGFFAQLGGNELGISQDGKTWQKYYPDQAVYGYSAIYGNGRYVMAGSDYFADKAISHASTNGLDWKTGPLVESAVFFYSATYASGKFFLAIDPYTGSYTSGDGLNWEHTSSTPTNVYTCAYGGGQFVGCAETRELYTSPDAVTWIKRATPDIFTKAKYIRNSWLALGKAGHIYSSTNAVDWSLLFATSNPLNDLAYISDAIIGVGPHGSIFQAGALLRLMFPITQPAIGTTRFKAMTHPDYSLRIEKTSDLINWNHLATLPPQTGTIEIQDTSPAGLSFYRSSVE